MSKRQILPLAIAAVFLMLHILCNFVPWKGSCWGMFHLSFFSGQVQILIAMLALLPIGWALWVGNNDLSSVNGRVPWIEAALVLVGLSFYVFRTSHFLYGDGYGFISEIGDPLWPLNGKEAGEVLLHRGLYRAAKHILPAISGFDIYRWVSIFSGWTFLWFVHRYLRSSEVSLLDRALILVIFAASGTTFLFYGYPENYSVFNLSIFLYFMLASAAFRTGRVLWPSVLLLLSIFLHLAGLALLPAHFILLLSVSGAFEKRRTRWLVLMIFLAIAAAALTGLKDVGFRGLILPLMPTASRPYALLSTAHIIDMINAVILSVPIVAILLAAAGRRTSRGPEYIFYAISALGMLSGLVLLDKVYEAADWDLLSFIGWPLVFWAVKTVREGKTTFNRAALLGASLSIMIFHNVPWVISNNSSDIAVSQFAAIASRYTHSDRMMLFVRAMMQMNNAPEKLHEQALRLGRKALDTDTSDGRIYYNLVVACYNLERFKEATDYFEKSRPKLENNADILITVGNSYLRQDKYEAAAEVFKKALQSKPDLIELYYDIGYAYSYSGRHDSAETYLNKALRYFPERKEMLAISFYNYYKWEKYDQAMTVIDAMLKNDPEDVRAMFSKGIVLFLKDRPDLAREVWKKALLKAPSDKSIIRTLELLGEKKLQKSMF